MTEESKRTGALLAEVVRQLRSYKKDRYLLSESVIKAVIANTVDNLCGNDSEEIIKEALTR